MRTYTNLDLYLLMLLGLVFNTIVPMETIAPDFLLAAFVVLIIPKHHGWVPLLAGAILLIFTALHSSLTFPALLQVSLSGIIIYCLAHASRKHFTHQGLWMVVISLVGTLAGGCVSSLFSGESLIKIGFWALLTTLVAYTFYIGLDFGERIFSAQYRNQ